MTPIERHHFDCDCGSDEHTFKFAYDPDDGDLYLSVYLDQYRTFFQRLGTAIKYAFGYTSKWGHWDTTILSRDDAARLAALCQRSIVARDAYVASHTQASKASVDAAVSDEEIDTPDAENPRGFNRIVIPEVRG